ncbi:MAG: hypothetical protein H7644_05985 [Candidatus Heimdallarchaeota archaeon]|nr:hypothetical protein [Candidatus Heimdallarchaeota archaeon]MCK5143297.1 hypothetical protein [Candidatus Heimdallarchaeota archaeon]
MGEQEEIRDYLSESSRRMVLSQIISYSKAVSASELLDNLPIKNRSTLYNILDRLTELNLITRREVKFGGSNRVFYSPNHELISGDYFRNLLLEFKDLERPSILTLDFKYTWEDFPECLITGNSLRLAIVFGSWMTEAANTIDALNVPEISQTLSYWAYRNKKIPFENIIIDSLLDYQAGYAKNENMLVIGSGAVNRITSEIMELYGNSLPVKFLTPSSKNIYSKLTDITYSEESPVGLLSGLLALLPNPWDKSKVIILCAGSKNVGTQATLKALLDDIKAAISMDTKVISNHSKFPKIPVRVIKAEGEDLLTKMIQQKSPKIQQYSFVE